MTVRFAHEVCRSESLIAMAITRFQGVLHGVLASRIIFDLRAQAAHWDEEHNIQLTPHVDSSDLQFASQMIPLTVLHDDPGNT